MQIKKNTRTEYQTTGRGAIQIIAPHLISLWRCVQLLIRSNALGVSRKHTNKVVFLVVTRNGREKTVSYTEAAPPPPTVDWGCLSCSLMKRYKWDKSTTTAVMCFIKQLKSVRVFFHLLIHPFIHLFNQASSQLSNQARNRSLIHWCMDSLIHSLIHSFIHSFMRIIHAI